MRTFAQAGRQPGTPTPSSFPWSRVGARIQTKLAVSAPGDAYEREADRIADAVVAGRPPQLARVRQSSRPGLYRKVMQPEDLVDSMPPPGEEPAAGSAGPTEEVQRSATGEPGAVTPTFEQTLERAAGGGEELPAPTRSFMESRFGWDFSAVRVHRDARADALARDVNARAFTLGDDIFFARSQYQPDSPRGQRLLAHELTHVVQQSEGRVARKIQRATRCVSYSGYNTSASLTSYNCAGLALRTYQDLSPPSAVYDAIVANFIGPITPSKGCDAGEVKFWMWEYKLHAEDDRGNVIARLPDDFHIVAGRVDAAGNDPSDVYSKNGKRPVYGPSTGPFFRPPARERATANTPSETPVNTPQGRPVYKIRSNMTQHISCAGCHP